MAMAEEGPEESYLFGGAFSACLPPGSMDISKIRQVPDNQEVFAHPNTDQSIIVELLEYQAGVPDETAARYHFEDIADSSPSLEIMSEIAPGFMVFEGCSSAWKLMGYLHVAKLNEEAKNCVCVHLVLLRLPQYETDFLVTFNDPSWIDPLSSSAGQNIEVPLGHSLPPWTVEQFHAFVGSLRLLDPGLFG